VPGKPVDLHKMVREVLAHTSPLVAAADRPLVHFEDASTEAFALIKYVGRRIRRQGVYPEVYDRQMGHLRQLVLAELLQAFERFLKEIAAVCIDFLAPYVADDRFDEFLPKTGGHIAAFVNAQSIGKALCESDTWLRHETINRRFRRLLKFPFGEPWEFLFPEGNQPPATEQERAKTLAVLWQLRHCCAHNLGVMTASDSMKFRMLVGAPVAANCRLSPSTDDLRFVSDFLSETAQNTNQRIGQRLALVLEHFHLADASLFDGQLKANEVSQRFVFSVTINGHVGVR